MTVEPDSDPVPIQDIRRRLEELTSTIDRLPSLANPPKTTLSILGEARTEACWEAVLKYFLDPSASHGFDTDVLEAFLNAVSAYTDCSLTPRGHQLSEVKIASQVSADGGIPDILLWVADEWFCCIELKAHSGESAEQTIRYANSRALGPVRVSDFPESNRHYVYLAPASKSAPASEEFATLDWEDVVPQLSNVLSSGRGRYPSKSRAQLADFIDTLQAELAMTDYQQYEREKVELAIEYGPEIQTVQSALQGFIQQELDSWDEDFLASAPPDWNTDLGGQKYPRIYPKRWLFDATGRVETEDTAGLILNYVSQIDEESLLNQELTIDFKRQSGSDANIEEKIYDILYADAVQSQLRSLADEHALTLFDRNEGVQIFKTSVSLDIGSDETIGGQFAERIRELEPVNDVIDNALSEY